MSTVKYISAMGIVLMGIYFTPDMEMAMKVYVISVVTLVTALINLLFRIQKLRVWIVDKIIMDVMVKIYTDKDLRNMIIELKDKTQADVSPDEKK